MSRARKTTKAAPKSYYEQPHAKRAALLAGNVPRELREKRIWVLWQGVFDSDRNKWDKIPCYTNSQPRRGQNGSEDDRAALVTFEQALAAYKSNPRMTGLGIALLDDENIIAVDIDGLHANQDAASLAKTLSNITYAETSPSGRGCRAIFLGKARSQKRAPVELFGDSGFVTVTGMNANKKRVAPFDKAPPALEQMFASRPADKPSQENGGSITHARKLREVLEDIPNDDLAYDDWLQIVQAIHHSRHGDSTGYKIALEWSQSSEKHEQKKFDTAWNSSGKREEGAPLVTFGALLHKAGHRKQTERSPAPGRVRPPLELWRKPLPIPKELWGVYVRKSIVTVLAGPGGSYKSALLLAMVTRRSASGGGEYLGQPVAPGKTLIVLAEDRIEDCIRRAHSIAHHFNVPIQSVRDAVEFIELTGTDWTDMVDLEYGKAVITQTGQHIEQEARASGCDLIIIETANRVTAEETNPVFRKLIAELERIAKATGAAVVITSHVSKAAGRAGTDDHHAARGGGALTDNARSVLIVSVPEDGTEEAARGMRYLTHAKSTHSEAARQVLLEIKKLPNCGLPMLSDAVPVKEIRRETMRLDVWDRARLLAERTMGKLGCDEVTANQMRQCLKNSGIAFNELAGALETAVVKKVLLETEVTRKGRRFAAYRLSTSTTAGRKAR